MTNARIDGLRSIELGVHDLQKSAEFYRRVWALEDVAAEGDTIHLRGTGREHHVVTLRERPRASLLGVHFSAPDQRHGGCAACPGQGHGRQGRRGAGPLEASAGGGYGFRVSTPEGHPISISSDVAAHARSDRRPLAADQAHPRRAQQRRGGEADRVLPRRARLQVERLDLHDGLRALLLRPSQRGVRARQRADAQSHGLRDAEHRRPDERRRPRAQERLRDPVGRRPARPRQQRVLLFRRAERLRHRIHHRGRAGRRQLCRPRRRMVEGAESVPVPLEHGEPRRPSSRARPCRANCTRKRTSAASR